MLTWSQFWYGVKPMLPILLSAVALGALSGLIKRLFEDLVDYLALRSGVAGTDKMSGRTFEKWLQHQFKRAGYKVRRTPYQGDHGADLIVIHPNGKRIAVQAKQLSGRKAKVGARALGEALRGAKYYGCQESWVVTNRAFTDQAKDEARKCNITLIDRYKLADFIKSIDERNV